MQYNTTTSRKNSKTRKVETLKNKRYTDEDPSDETCKMPGKRN
jgi:hypothetical protein